jgi:hypothetical protein
MPRVAPKNIAGRMRRVAKKAMPSRKLKTFHPRTNQIGIRPKDATARKTRVAMYTHVTHPKARR